MNTVLSLSFKLFIRINILYFLVLLDMSNRNFDNSVIIKRLQDKNYARNLLTIQMVKQ